jgi:glycosyltransferase involved in cell wall biosynthesis/peptidoglycan/xylan/chitin deacetylase (PgdA/CDA1 family)
VTRTRVLHLIWALDLGGAERQVVEIVRRTDRRRFEPFVGCLVRKGRWGNELEAEGVPVVDFAKRPGLDLSLLPRLVRFLRRGRFDVLHTHAFTAASWGRLAALLARTPVVVSHEHSAFSLDSSVRRFVDRALVPATDRWIAVSEALARDLVAAEALPISRVVLVRNGIPLEEDTPPADAVEARRSLGIPAFREVVGTVGRLEPRKGLEVFLDAARGLAARRPSLGVLLVGEGPLQPDLERRIRSLGLEGRVVLTGRRDDIPRVLAALDVFVLSSHTEGLSIALLEAAAAARPIVATAVGGNPEVIEDGRSGRLVPAGDADALERAVGSLLDDPDLARRLGSAAARVVRARFSSRGMVDDIESLYSDLLPPAAGAPRPRFKAVRHIVPGHRTLRVTAARAASLLHAPPHEPALRILAYHRVNDRHPGDRQSVHPLTFHDQLDALARSSRPVLPLAEAVTRLRGRGPALPRGAVSLTFDGGHADSLQIAGPILARFGFSATVFVATGRMGTRAATDRYEGCCRHDRALEWEDVLELTDRGHEVGGHGRTYVVLPTLEPAALRDEVRGCHEDLGRHLGVAPRLFSYPRGRQNSDVRRAVGEAGFEAAVTACPGPNEPQTDPFLLCRTEISADDDLPAFTLKLAGAFDPWRRGWVQRAAD